MALFQAMREMGLRETQGAKLITVLGRDGRRIHP
jgi:hypothetical protein